MNFLARLAALILLVGTPVWAGEAHVAVATNFRATLEELQTVFAAETGHSLVVSTGSTGQLYAQIAHGAPYDVFLAADQDRPALAIADGHAVDGTTFTYAEGRLILLWPGREILAEDPAPDLSDLHRVSLANPRTAPYGVAAMQVLDSLDVAGIEIAYAQNAAGVAAAIEAGAAPAGLTARSLVGNGAGWTVPLDLHDPIRQDAVLLKRGDDNPAARAFLDWLGRAKAREIIRAHGYDVD